MEKISSELDYSPSVSNHSTIIYRNVAPQGSNQVLLSSSSAVGPTTFLLAPTVYNLARSRLNFTLLLPATASKVNYVQGNLNTIINRIVVTDSNTSAVLCDISNFDKYSSMLSGPSTELVDFLTKSYDDVATSITGSNALRFVREDIEKSNLASNNRIGMTGGDFDMGSENAYLSRRQYYVGPDSQELRLNVSLPLGGFKHCVLATDKNLYSPSNIQVDIYFNGTDTFSFTSNSATVPSSVPTSVATPSAGNYQINDLVMEMATEGNLSIVSQTINKVMSSGLSLEIPYPTLTRQTIQGQYPSYQLQLTRGLGNRILYIATAPFINGGSLNQAQIHSTYFNTTTWGFSRINTFINSVAIKYPNGFNVDKGEDWFYNSRAYFKKSSVQTEGTYRKTDFVFIDSFFGDKPLCDLDPHSVDGLSLTDSSSVWSVQATLDSSRTVDFYTLIVGQKTLSVSNMGIQVQ